jgi:hypothetical protein
MACSPSGRHEVVKYRPVPWPLAAKVIAWSIREVQTSCWVRTRAVEKTTMLPVIAGSHLEAEAFQKSRAEASRH